MKALKKKLLGFVMAVVMTVAVLPLSSMSALAASPTFKPGENTRIINDMTLTNNHDGTVTLGNIPTFETASGNGYTIYATELKWGYEAAFGESKYFIDSENFTILHAGGEDKSYYEGAADLPANNKIDVSSITVWPGSYYSNTPRISIVALSTKYFSDNQPATFGGQIFTLPTKVTYDLNGGTAGAGFTDTDWVLSGKEWLTKSGVVNHDIAPTKDGCTFEGWYTAAVGGTKVTTTAEADAAAESPTSGSGARSVTLYAHWSNNFNKLTTSTVSITLDNDNMSFDDAKKAVAALASSYTPKSTDVVIYCKDGENYKRMTYSGVWSDTSGSHDLQWYKDSLNEQAVYVLGTVKEPSKESTSTGAPHVHNYVLTTICSPSEDHDGEYGYVCSCGDVQSRWTVSTIETIFMNRAQLIEAAKAGQTVTLDMGTLNSLPNWFMKMLANKNSTNFKIKFTYNHKNYEMNIPAETTIDLADQYYGPLKLMSLYETIQKN